MDSKDQLEKWLKGESIHNKKSDECCPDFSCCIPSLLAPEEERKKFATAYYNNDEENMYSMLLDFLEKMIANHTELKDANIHIAREED